MGVGIGSDSAPSADHAKLDDGNMTINSSQVLSAPAFSNLVDRANLPTSLLSHFLQRADLMAKLARMTEQSTPCLLLQNMVSIAEVEQENGVTELQAEVADECASFGAVKKVLIHCPKGAPEVKVFVLFDNATDSSKAYSALHNRIFGGRKVVARYYSTDTFVAGQYDA